MGPVPQIEQHHEGVWTCLPHLDTIPSARVHINKSGHRLAALGGRSQEGPAWGTAGRTPQRQPKPLMQHLQAGRAAAPQQFAQGDQLLGMDQANAAVRAAVLGLAGAGIQMDA